MRLFVTGVCGQLGHDVVNNAIDRGYEAVGSDIQSVYSGIADGSAVTSAPYVQLDITDKEAVKTVISEIKPDVIQDNITISAPEEIAYINGFIDKDKLRESAKLYGKSPYGEHLKAVAEGKIKY